MTGSSLHYARATEPVGAAFSREEVGYGKGVYSAKAHSRAIDSIERGLAL
jgi:hypothetical protein